MFWFRKRNQSDFSAELRAHLQLEGDRIIAEEGLNEADAYAKARRNLGNIMKSEERLYEASRWLWFDHFQHDLRYALRQLLKNKGFASLAVLALALGIGANTAIFSLIDAVMLKSLPVADPSQLFELGDGSNCCEIGGYDQGDYTAFSYSLYKQLHDQTPEFEIAAFQTDPGPVPARRGGDSAPSEPFVREFVSGNYFSMFGIHALYGRALTPSDDRPGALPVAVLSYRVWRQRYAPDLSVIGSTFIVDGIPVSIVGIAPPAFFGDTLRSDPPDLWVPLSAEPVDHGKNSMLNIPDLHWLYAIGRLRPGTRLATLQAKINTELRQWLRAQGGPTLAWQYRDLISQQHIRLVPAGGGIAHMKNDYRDGLLVLMTLSGLVLLIACANVANLLLARGAAGRIQTALRMALGAARSRVIRQMLTESLVLALLGGAAGVFVAYAGTRAILLLAFRGAAYIPITPDPSIPVLAFSFFLSLLTGVVFGIAPAWMASQSDPAEALRGANRSTGEAASLPQKTLIVLQAALSLVLLAGAGMLTQSLRNLEDQQFGFQTNNRLIVKVEPLLTGYSLERVSTLYQRLDERLRQIPGVVSASFSGYAPMEGNNWNDRILIEGRPVAAGPENRGSTSLDRVGPRYFQTIGTRLLRGREIGEQDTQAAPHVAVVNQTFAERYFKNQNPIGKHLGMARVDEFQIVGLVGDAKYQNAYQPAYPTVFLPLLQLSAGELSDGHLPGSSYIHDIELHVAGPLNSIEPAVRRALNELDPNLSVLRVLSFNDQVNVNFNQERLIARIAGLFGLLALILASIGLYGVTAYSVARRTSEIGVRIALGATRGEVVGMVLRRAFLQIAAGLLIGVPVAIAGSSLMSNRLYGVKQYDPLVLGGAVLLLAGCALIAAFVPARRATRIDAMQALRTE